METALFALLVLALMALWLRYNGPNTTLSFTRARVNCFTRC